MRSRQNNFCLYTITTTYIHIILLLLLPPPPPPPSPLHSASSSSSSVSQTTRRNKEKYVVYMLYLLKRNRMSKMQWTCLVNSLLFFITVKQCHTLYIKFSFSLSLSTCFFSFSVLPDYSLHYLFDVPFSLSIFCGMPHTHYQLSSCFQVVDWIIFFLLIFYHDIQCDHRSRFRLPRKSCCCC